MSLSLSDLQSQKSRDYHTFLGIQKEQAEEVKEEVKEVIIIKSQRGVKIEKHDDTYLVVDIKNKKSYPYNSVTWADKKFERLNSVFSRA